MLQKHWHLNSFYYFHHSLSPLCRAFIRKIIFCVEINIDSMKGLLFFFVFVFFKFLFKFLFKFFFLKVMLFISLKVTDLAQSLAELLAQV